MVVPGTMTVGVGGRQSYSSSRNLYWDAENLRLLEDQEKESDKVLESP